MTVQTFKRAGKWAVLCVFAVSLAGVMTGCKSQSVKWNPFKSKQPPLMDGRGMIPPAYSEPGDAAAVTPQVPVEPQLDLTSPAGLPLGEPLEGLEVAPAAGEAVELPAIELPPVVEPQALTYEVQKGDSLWKIARTYGITYQELAAFNKMDVNGMLKVGTILQIPPGGKFVPESERPKVRSASSGKSSRAVVSAGSAPSGTRKLEADGRYKVRSGDNLWLIARDFKTKVSALRAANNLTSDILHIDQLLTIPAPGAAPAQAATHVTVHPQPTPGVHADPVNPPADDHEPMEVTPVQPVGDTPASRPAATELPNTLDYTVTEGDSLQNIADMFSIDISDITKANPGVTTDADLRPNMNIRIPLD